MEELVKGLFAATKAQEDVKVKKDVKKDLKQDVKQEVKKEVVA